MVKGRNIAKREVLIAVAGKLAAAHSEVLDLDRFVYDLETNAGVAAFCKDLQRVHYHRIGRVHTLSLSSSKGPSSNNCWIPALPGFTSSIRTGGP